MKGLLTLDFSYPKPWASDTCIILCPKCAMYILLVSMGKGEQKGVVTDYWVSKMLLVTYIYLILDENTILIHAF